MAGGETMSPTDRRGPAIGLAAVACLLACETSQSGGGVGPPPGRNQRGAAESAPDQQASVAFFDDSRMHEVRLWMSDDDFTSIIEDTRGDDMRSATFSIDGVVMARVGVRPSGESSRVPGNQKMSMRIEFDAFDVGKKMGGVDEVKVSGSWDDPFIVRDRLAYWVYRQVMPAPRETAAQVWVNGQPRGVFELEEVWGKEALASRFTDASGPLYRLRGLTNTDPYEYKGADPVAYVPLPWDPVGRSMVDPAADAVIGPALQVVAEDPARIGDVMDVDALLTYFAVSAIVSNTDGFTGPFEVDDHYQYADPATGRLRDPALGSRQHLRLDQRSAGRRHLPQLRAVRDHPAGRGRPAAGAVLREAGRRDEPGSGRRHQGSGGRHRRPDRHRRDVRHDQDVSDRELRLEPRLREGLDRRPLRIDSDADRGKASRRDDDGQPREVPREGESVCRRRPRPTAISRPLILALASCGGGSAATDGDFTTFQAPDDSTGGYVLATVPPGMGTVRATIYDGAGGSALASFVADAPGAALSFWWTSAPGQQTRIALRDDGGADYKYELTSSYTQVADPYEPNDAMDAAAPMPDGGQMSAFLFAGRRGGTNDPAAYDDYYRFTAQPGALSIRLDDVPADLAARVFLFRADGSEVARVSNGMRGAALALTPPAVTDAADFIVRVSLWDEAPAAAGAGAELPASFTQPYRLTVSQAQP